MISSVSAHFLHKQSRSYSPTVAQNHFKKIVQRLFSLSSACTKAKVEAVTLRSCNTYVSQANVFSVAPTFCHNKWARSVLFVFKCFLEKRPVPNRKSLRVKVPCSTYSTTLKLVWACCGCWTETLPLNRNRVSLVHFSIVSKTLNVSCLELFHSERKKRR